MRMPLDIEKLLPFECLNMNEFGAIDTTYCFLIALISMKTNSHNFDGRYQCLFLTETTIFRALIFGLLNYLVDLYQACSKHAPRAKKSPLPSDHMFYTGKII